MMPKVVGSRIENGLIEGCLEELPLPGLSSILMQASEGRFPSVRHCEAVWEGAESTRTLREKRRSRGDPVLCLGKAKVIDMLVWAHQCHLLAGKRLFGEFVSVGH